MSTASVRSLLSRTGTFDNNYQRRRLATSKRATAKSIITLILLFTLFTFTDFYVLSDPIELLKQRIIFAPSFVLLLALLAVTRSYLVFHLMSSLLFSSSGILFVALVYDGTMITAMYCTGVLSATLLATMPFLRTPLALSIIPSTLMVVFFGVTSSDLETAAWILNCGTLISLLTILIFSESVREIDEYKIFNEQRRLAKEQKEQKRWAYMTARLLRHELSNQLVGLSSSLDMLLRSDSGKNALFIPPAQSATYKLQKEINELALASEWSTLDDNATVEPELSSLATKSFSNYDIELSQSSDKTRLPVNGASKNIVLYALNRLSGSLSKHFTDKGLWGESAVSSGDMPTLEIILNQMPVQNAKEENFELMIKRFASDKDTNAAASLLESQGVLLKVFRRQKQLVLKLKLISNATLENT